MPENKRSGLRFPGAEFDAAVRELGSRCAERQEIQDHSRKGEEDGHGLNFPSPEYNAALRLLGPESTLSWPWPARGPVPVDKDALSTNIWGVAALQVLNDGESRRACENQTLRAGQEVLRQLQEAIPEMTFELKTSQAQGPLPRLMRLRCSKDGYTVHIIVDMKQTAMPRNNRIDSSDGLAKLRKIDDAFKKVPILFVCPHPHSTISLFFYGGANSFAPIVCIRMDNITPGEEFALDEDLRKLLIWTKSKIAAAMDGEKPFENIELEGLIVRQTIPPLVRSHYAFRVERAQELYMEAGDFDLTLVQTRSGDHGPMTRFGTIKLIGVKTSFFLNQRGIFRYKQLVDNMSSLIKDFQSFAFQIEGSETVSKSMKKQVDQLRNWADEVHCKNPDHVGVKLLPRPFICGPKYDIHKNRGLVRVHLDCHKCRLKQREENALVGHKYYPSLWAWNDERSFESDKAPRQCPRGEQDTTTPDPVTQALRQSKAMARWFSGLAAKFDYIAHVSNYIVLYPTTYFILAMLLNYSTINKIANVLVCADCKQPCFKLKQDHHHSEDFSIADFRDFICSGCNCAIRATVEALMKIADNVNEPVQPVLDRFLSIIEGYLDLSTKDPRVVGLQKKLDQYCEILLGIESGELANASMEKRETLLRACDRDWHHDAITRFRASQLSKDERNTLLHGSCFLSGISGDLVVDHCHRTGLLRGLIRTEVNIRLQQFVSDDLQTSMVAFRNAVKGVLLPPEERPLAKVVQRVVQDNPFFAAYGRMLCKKYNFPLWYPAPEGNFQRVHLSQFWPTPSDLKLDMEWILATLRPEHTHNESLFMSQFTDASLRAKKNEEKIEVADEDLTSDEVETDSQDATNSEEDEE